MTSKTRPKASQFKAVPLTASANPDRVAALMETAETEVEFDLAGAVLSNNAEDSKTGRVMAENGARLGSEKIPTGARDPVWVSSGLVLSVSDIRVGQVHEVPLALIVDSPRNARVHYVQEEVDELATELQADGQKVPAYGYVDGDKVKIVDGGKRLRAARAGGLETLRVDIHEMPASEKEVYKLSRQMNLQRSAQTCFDDAIRFRQMLDDGIFKDQEELGRELLNGASQATVSQILSLNKIPQQILRLMRDDPKKLCQVAFAFEVARKFSEGEVPEPSKIHTISEVLRRVSEEDLSLKKTQELFESRLGTPKARVQGTFLRVKFGAADGQIKLYKTKGVVELSMKGVPEDKIQELADRIQRAITEESSGS